MSMYKKYYGFDVGPFELKPDTDFFFLGDNHKEGLAFLKYGALAGKQLLMLTGGVGTGKSILVRVLLEHLENIKYCCVIHNPTISIEDFYILLAGQLNFEFSGVKADFLLAFREILEKCYQEKERIVLVLDEAHHLSVELFHEILFLLNQAIEHRDVVTIFLIGQPELLDRLTEKSLTAFRQRISTRFSLSSLTEKETEHYIMFRMNRAGGGGDNIFTHSALQAIYEASGGTPRLVNIICDNALLSGYATGKTIIDEDTVYSAVEQLRIPGEKDAFYLRPRRKKINRVALVALVALVLITVATVCYWLY